MCSCVAGRQSSSIVMMMSAPRVGEQEPVGADAVGAPGDDPGVGAEVRVDLRPGGDHGPGSGVGKPTLARVHRGSRTVRIRAAAQSKRHTRGDALRAAGWIRRRSWRLLAHELCILDLMYRMAPTKRVVVGSVK